MIKCPLLSFSPLTVETEFTARNYIEFIRFVLELFGKSTDKDAVNIGDNVSVNQKIAEDLKILLLGCYSHRLNYLPKNMLQSLTTLFQKFSNL